MSNILRKKQSRAYESQLLNINIVKQVKERKGIVLFRRLILNTNPIVYSQGSILRACPSQPTQLLLILAGSVKFQKQNETKSYFSMKYNHLILDRIITYAEVSQMNTIVISLCYKAMYFYFEGILPFPQLTQKIKILKKKSIFSQITTKQLIKIATMIEEMIIFIGSIVYQEGSICEYIYYLVQGSVLLTKNKKPISLLSEYSFFGDHEQVDQELAQFEETAKITSGKAILYKIPKSLINCAQLFDQKKYVQKKQWRKTRVKTVGSISKPKKSTPKHTQISFVQKQDLLKSFYKSSYAKVDPQAKAFFSSLQKKYSSEQQFYEQRLNYLQKLRHKKYGPIAPTTVFFPFNQKKSHRSKSAEKASQFLANKTCQTFSFFS